MRRPGLTLIELLLVVALLAVTALVAVRSTSQIARQNRFDSARRNLREIDESLVGPPHLRQSDGSMTVVGFVADVGRLPRAVGADRSTQAAELWSNPRGLLPYGLRPAPSDSEVMVEGGWRGPYLRLPVGDARLRDGWGNAFDWLKADGSPADDGDPIARVRSRGADNAVDVGPASDDTADLTLTISDGTVDRARATLTGRLYETDGSGNLIDPTVAVTVRLYLPDPSVASGVSEVTQTVSAAPWQYSFASVPVGPRVLRAYLGARRSRAVRVVVTSLAIGPDLIIRP